MAMGNCGSRFLKPSYKEFTRHVWGGVRNHEGISEMDASPHPPWLEEVQKGLYSPTRLEESCHPTTTALSNNSINNHRLLLGLKTQLGIMNTSCIRKFAGTTQFS
jgi:hypothetical protein